LKSPNWLSTQLSTSKVDIERQLEQTHVLYFYLELYQAIIFCIHSKWTPAREMLSTLEEKLKYNTFRNSPSLSRWITYLQAVMEQGCGNVEVAAQLYQSTLSQQSSKVTMASKRPGSASDDLSILSRLNLLFILRDPEKPPSPVSETLLQDLDSMDAAKHPNPAIRSAMGLISAMINPREAITKKKAALQQALTGSRSINNGQLLAVTMAAMVSMFFTDIVVGDQARKSRHTARVLAKKAENPLWISVADGLALQGEQDPNEQYVLWQEIERNMDKLEGSVQKRFLNA
jgi:Cohesin loading factor